MYRYNICPAEQLFERHLRIILFAHCARGRGVGHLAAKGCCQTSHLATNGTHTNYSPLRATQLSHRATKVEDVLGCGVCSILEVVIEIFGVFEERECEVYSRLCYRRGRVACNILNTNAQLCRHLQIDIVHSCSGNGNKSQVG